MAKKPAVKQLPPHSLARTGSIMGLCTGAVMLGLCVYLLAATRAPTPLAIAFGVAGIIETVGCAYALRLQRAGWAFACALNGVSAVVFLFGAPKLRDVLDVPLFVSLMPCLFFGLMTVLLALGSHEYEVLE